LPRPRCAATLATRRHAIPIATTLFMRSSSRGAEALSRTAYSFLPFLPSLPALRRRGVYRRSSRRRAAVVDAVEQQLEGAMRLPAPGNLVPEQHDVSLADRRLHDRDSLIEVVLSPCPAAAQRRRILVPRHRLDPFERGFGRQAERGAFVV